MSESFIYLTKIDRIDAPVHIALIFLHVNDIKLYINITIFLHFFRRHQHYLIDKTIIEQLTTMFKKGFNF